MCLKMCLMSGRRFRGGHFLPSHPVVSAGDKIISVRGELGVPHRVVVALVANEASKRLETPQSDRSIFRTRQQVVSRRPREEGEERHGQGAHHQTINSCWFAYFVKLYSKYIGIRFIKMTRRLRFDWHLSGLKLTPYTGPLCPWRILDSLAVFSSMILSSTSSDSLSIKFKSAEREVERTQRHNVDGVSQRFSAQRSEIHKPPSGVVPPADLTLRSFFGVTLHTRTVESAKPPAIRLESSVKSTAVRPCGGEAKSFFPHLELGKYTS